MSSMFIRCDSAHSVCERCAVVWDRSVVRWWTDHHLWWVLAEAQMKNTMNCVCVVCFGRSESSPSSVSERDRRTQPAGNCSLDLKRKMWSQSYSSWANNRRLLYFSRASLLMCSFFLALSPTRLHSLSVFLGKQLHAHHISLRCCSSGSRLPQFLYYRA